MDLMITNVDLLCSDGSFWTDRDVLIDKGRIKAVEPSNILPHCEVSRVIDGRGLMMLPGLINAHFHSHDRFDRGRFDNLPLELWMAAYNTPLGSRQWTAEDCYLRTKLTCLEQMRSGVTTIIDDVFHGDISSEEKIEAVFQAYEDSGLRAMVTIACSDLPYHETIPFLDGLLPDHLRRELAGTAADPDKVLKIWRSFAGRYRGRIRFAISTSGPQRCSDSFQVRAWELARELDLPVFTHTLETKVQELTAHLKYGQGMVCHLKDLGLLTPRTNLVHLVWPSREEIDLIAESGAKVVHNPISNLKLGSGIAPVGKLLKAGVQVALGTDNNGCNDSANLLEAMKYAALLGKVLTGRYDEWPGARESMAMATKGGAACFGQDDIGDLSPGFKADFSLFRLDHVHFYPSHDRLNQLIFAAGRQSPELLVVDGKVVFECGRAATIDEDRLNKDLMTAEDRIINVISKASHRSGELLPYIGKAYDICLGLAGVSGLERS